MVVFLVLGAIALMILFDMFVIYPIQQSKKAKKEKPEFFYSEELGVTMADGGELVDDKDKK